MAESRRRWQRGPRSLRFGTAIHRPAVSSVPEPAGRLEAHAERPGRKHVDYNFALSGRLGGQKRTLYFQTFQYPRSRAERKGFLQGKRFRTASGLEAVLHEEFSHADNRYNLLLVLPVAKSKAAFILTSGGAGTETKQLRPFLISLFRHVHLIPAGAAGKTRTKRDSAPQKVFNDAWDKEVQSSLWYLRQRRALDADGSPLGHYVLINKKKPPKHGETSDYITLLDNMRIGEVRPWHAPQPSPEEPKGVMLVLEYPASSYLHYTIIADIGGELRRVLDVDQGHSWYPRPLEQVDLDGDTFPELISVDDYAELRYGKGGVARVWKWNRRLSKYRLVRTSSYARRLRPLR